MKKTEQLTIKDIKKITKYLLQSHKRASEHLASTGVYTKKGNLTKRFK